MIPTKRNSLDPSNSLSPERVIKLANGVIGGVGVGNSITLEVGVGVGFGADVDVGADVIVDVGVDVGADVIVDSADDED